MKTIRFLGQNLWEKWTCLIQIHNLTTTFWTFSIMVKTVTFVGFCIEILVSLRYVNSFIGSKVSSRES